MLKSEIAGWKVGQIFDQTARRTNIGKCKCILTRQGEFLELAARRRQWVSSTKTPVDKSLIGALSGNKILIGGLSGMDAGVDVVAEQSPL